MLEQRWLRTEARSYSGSATAPLRGLAAAILYTQETRREATSSSETPAPEAPNRWEFLRDVLVFQVKLLLDAVRDLVLSPISIVAGVIDLISGDEPPGRHFYRLVAFGERTDTWINLFGMPGRPEEPDGDESVTIDSLVAQVERLMVDQYERGGITASAKQAIDRTLNAISRKTGN